MIPASATKVAAGVAAGEFSCREVAEHFLQQIQRLEPSLRAWVLVDAEAALEQARRLDQQLAAGRSPGPLCGVVLGIKDIIDVAGWPTRAGSSLLPPEPATADAPVVSRLRRAGAVLVGKTVTTAFACFDPPPTRNPWHADHTPGGSSSGSAAAVAARMCLGALGSQTGGSIVRPAAYCGVVGFKGSFGAASRRGVVPVSQHLDHVGPLACCVADAALLWSVIQGYDPQDPWSDEDDPARSEATAGPLPLAVEEPPRLGVIEAPLLELAAPSLRQAYQQTLDRLAQAGAELVPLPLPWLDEEVVRHHWCLMVTEAACWHLDRFADGKRERMPWAEYPPGLRKLLQEGLQTPVEQYHRAIAFQREFRRRVQLALEPVAAALMPAVPDVAPAPAEQGTGDARFNLPWSLAGVPALGVPAGLIQGLPWAVQLIGRRGEDSRLLQVGAWVENVLGPLGTPPGVDESG